MKKFIKLFTILVLALLIFLTVYFSENIKIAVFDSLIFCGSILIPSLLPMMFITFLLINSGALNWLPKKAVGIFIFSITCVSGYPSSGKVFGNLAKNGALKSSEVQRLIPTTVCAGPAFIVNFIGCTLFNSKLIGIMLYTSLVLSNLVIFLCCGGAKLSISKISFKSHKNILVSSAKESFEAVTAICTYVLIFSAASEIIYYCFGDLIRKIFIYLTEITGAVTNTKNVYLVCALLSYGGLCVFMQILSLADNLKINFLKYIKIRIISCIISILLLKILFLIFPQNLNTYTNLDSPAILSINSEKACLITLIVTLITLLFSLKRSSTGKFLNDIEVI